MCCNINKIKLKLIFWEWVDVNWMNGDVFDLMIIGVRELLIWLKKMKVEKVMIIF